MKREDRQQGFTSNLESSKAEVTQFGKRACVVGEDGNNRVVLVGPEEAWTFQREGSLPSLGKVHQGLSSWSKLIVDFRIRYLGMS